MKPVDVASIPQLNGIFAPTQDEVDMGPLKVVQGSIPRELIGVYLHNGPNCRFPPLGSYTYHLDGERNATRDRAGRRTARYRNRYVRTPGLAAEERAGRALWGGTLTPLFPSKDEVGPELAGQFKDFPDISVIHHAGRYFALAESNRPFQVTRDLATVGPWDFGGKLPDGICAHPKIDPMTGELVVFRYGFARPYLTWAIIGRDGTVGRAEEPIALDRPFMIHDFVLTEHYLVFFICPGAFDMTGPASSVFQWRPERGTRIALVPRHGSDKAIRWIDAEAFSVWHFANAFERIETDGSTTVTVDYPRWSHLGFGNAAPATCGVVRAEIRLADGSVKFDQRDDQTTEFLESTTGVSDVPTGGSTWLPKRAVGGHCP